MAGSTGDTGDDAGRFGWLLRPPMAAEVFREVFIAEMKRIVTPLIEPHKTHHVNPDFIHLVDFAIKILTKLAWGSLTLSALGISREFRKVSPTHVVKQVTGRRDVHTISST